MILKTILLTFLLTSACYSMEDFKLDVENFPSSLMKKSTQSAPKLKLKAKNAKYLEKSILEFNSIQKELTDKLTLNEKQVNDAVELHNNIQDLGLIIEKGYKDKLSKGEMDKLWEKNRLLNSEFTRIFPSSEVGSLFTTLAKSYCGDCIHYLGRTSTKKFEQILNYSKELVRKVDLKKCFPDRESFIMSAECENSYNYCSGYLNLKGTGEGLYSEQINKELSITSHKMNTWDDYNKLIYTKEFKAELTRYLPGAEKQIRNITNEYLFAFCKLVDAYNLPGIFQDC